MGTVRLSSPPPSTRRWSSSFRRSSPLPVRKMQRKERRNPLFRVQAKTCVTRKNICVVIYQLGRKIEIFRDAGEKLVMTEIRVSN